MLNNGRVDKENIVCVCVCVCVCAMCVCVCLYLTEYDEAVKKNEILSFEATWMQLEAIILSELTQEQKTKYHMFSPASGR